MKDDKVPELFPRNHGRNEANVISLALAVVFGVVILGTLFPIIETMATWIFIVLIIVGIGMLVGHRLREMGKMYHVLHADPEILRREEQEEFYLLTLERDYDLDDEPE